MNKTLILLRTSLINHFSIHEMMDSKSNKRNGSFLVAVGIFTVAIFLFVYNIITAISLVKANQTSLIPAYMNGVSSFAVLLLTIFYSNGILFGSKDFERLCALPVKGEQIIASKFYFLYFLNLAICSVFMIPGGIVWLLNSEFFLDKVAIYFISILFTPLIPMCFAALIGVLISYLSSKTKRTNLFALLFSFIALGGVMTIYFNVMTNTGGTEIREILLAQITSMYPFSRWFLFYRTETILPVIAFILLSAISFVIFFILIGKNYVKINYMVSKHSSNIKKNYKIVRKSQFTTLFQKEITRFFGSYMYVLNAGLGVILLFALNIYIIFIEPNSLSSILGIPNPIDYLTVFAPIIVSTLLSLSCPSASSISLEGNKIWILQTAPVSIKTIIDSKIAFTICLHFIPYILSVIVMSIKFKITGLNLILLILIPIVYSIFTAISGIYFNIKYPNFEWENEIVVIKQSVPVVLSAITTMTFIVIPVLILSFTNVDRGIIFGITSLIMISISLYFYEECYKKKLI